MLAIIIKWEHQSLEKSSDKVTELWSLFCHTPESLLFPSHTI